MSDGSETTIEDDEVAYKDEDEGYESDGSDAAAED
jgi:hypothetical protein